MLGIRYNKLLAASWQVRKENLSCVEQIKWRLKLCNDFSLLIYAFIYEFGYSHDEFVALLKRYGIQYDPKFVFG